jgi:hypothetical protein
MNGCSEAGIAARICGDLVLNGYSDWYLPSKDELNKLYINRVAIGGFANNYYWSSTEGYTYNETYNEEGWVSTTYTVDALVQYFDFNNGFQSLFNKNVSANVRAVRAF